MRRYELMLLLRPDLEDDRLQSAVEKVTRAIVNAGGSLSKVSPWGKRRLAYDIGHHREASYFLIHFDVEPAAVREIERGMLISEEILRHLVTVLEDRGASDGVAEAARTDAAAPASAEASAIPAVPTEAAASPAESAEPSAPTARSRRAGAEKAQPAAAAADQPASEGSDETSTPGGDPDAAAEGPAAEASSDDARTEAGLPA